MDMKIMSIGFFVKPSDALLWRGAMAVNALRQMIHQTRWGALDFLLVDLPPGTGDIHLSIISELKIDTAVIVSTPSQTAVGRCTARRGDVPQSAGEHPPGRHRRKHGLVHAGRAARKPLLPLRKGSARRFAEENGIDLLGEIPIIQSIMEGADTGTPSVSIDARVEPYYREIADRIVDKVVK